MLRCRHTWWNKHYHRLSGKIVPEMTCFVSIRTLSIYSINWAQCGVWSSCSVKISLLFTAWCTIVQSAVLRSHVVCLSVCPSVSLWRWWIIPDCVSKFHIGWKSWKLIAWTSSPTSSLFIAQRTSTYSQGNMEKFWGRNVRSTPTFITSGWIESTESLVILGGGVAVCLLLSAHRARSSLR